MIIAILLATLQRDGELVFHINEGLFSPNALAGRSQIVLS